MLSRIALFLCLSALPVLHSGCDSGDGGTTGPVTDSLHRLDSLADSTGAARTRPPGPNTGDQGILVDARDGRVYRTLRIAGVVWMAENLRYDTIGRWYRDDQKLSDSLGIGRYYLWQVAMAGASESDFDPSDVRGICPEGWHLPSRTEWWLVAGNTSRSKVDGKVIPAIQGAQDIGFDPLAIGSVRDGSTYIQDEGISWWNTARRGVTSLDPEFGWLLESWSDPNPEKLHPVRCVADGGRAPRPTHLTDSRPFQDSLQLSLVNVTRGATLHFTTDGSTPTAASPTMDRSPDALDDLWVTTIRSSCVFQVIAIHPGMAPSPAAIRFFHRIVPSDPSTFIPWNPLIQYDSIVDARDGHTYRTVRIYDQVWFAENFAYDAPGSRLTADSEDSTAKYGRMYDWATAVGVDTMYNHAAYSGPPTKGICPEGWRVPTANDWRQLFYNIMGGGGSPLTAIGSGPEFQGGVDMYGFRGLPGDYLAGDGSTTRDEATKVALGLPSIHVTTRIGMSLKTDPKWIRCVQ